MNPSEADWLPTHDVTVERCRRKFKQQNIHVICLQAPERNKTQNKGTLLSIYVLSAPEANYLNWISR